MWLVVLPVMAVLCAGLLYRGRATLSWVVPGAIGLAAWAVSGPSLRHPLLFTLVLAVYGSLAVVFGIPALRRSLVTARLLPVVSRMLPRMSETERIALEAGTVWWDGDLFSGNPDWKKLAGFGVRRLDPREQAFLDGPVDTLCRMLDDFEISRSGDLPPEVWSFLKEERFFGMIVPEAYGGLGFSAAAHSAVVARVAGRSVAASVTVMVPNSLGPAELILHYGTEEQKNRYLPRLARGEEIPCFALTEPKAGSDAASGESEGIVCRGVFEGREVLGMRLTWNKRYITLSPVATLIGLAFKLRDPDRLLGEREDLGITCALIPAGLPGIEIGDRHDPLHVRFLNGPTRGKDVFVPLDFIIGGPSMAGQGWRMLMESLAAGRSISLPALSAGGGQVALRVTGAYAAVREQFKLPIGGFEGIQERLARIAGLTYVMDAARILTAGAVDAGEKPAVLSAVVKAYLTEANRVVINDAMDVTGGAGISRGPRNVLAEAYAALPIGITVEGANILTRSLIVFGQGAIRCHPFVLEEIRAAARRDLARFDRAFFGHMGFVFTNAARAWILGLTGGRPARPPLGGDFQPIFGELTRMSAAFALVADASMAVLGADLKRREMLSGRMGDALAWMYLTSAVLKRTVDEGHAAEDAPAARWACEHGLHRIQTALSGVLDNFPHPAVRWARRALVFPRGARRRPPSDRLVRKVAESVTGTAPGRTRLTRLVFVPPPGEPGLGRLEETLARIEDAAPVEETLRSLVRSRRIARGSRTAMVEEALEAGLIGERDAALVRAADRAREEAVQVDAFGPEHFQGHAGDEAAPLRFRAGGSS